MAGEVIAVGVGVGSEMLGTSVCALVAGGGYAEYCVAPAAQCLRIPDGLTMVEAAAIPETMFTVWTNVFQRGRAVHGETMLVHGGTSGIGTMAIALGKALGMTVITTAGTAEKCARAEAIGAAHAINYRAQDFVTEVQRVTDGRGCDLVLDMVGGDYVARNLACLAVEGRHISIAMLNGAKAEVFIPAIMQKRLTLTGSTLRPRDGAFKAAVATELREKVWPLVASGKLRPVIDSTYPLNDTASAHARMDGGTHVGKIVLTIAAIC